MVPQEFPSLQLQSVDGARAVIAVDGAHVTSWVPAGASRDWLFVSERSFFGPGASIRGGIPVIFPQFGSFGPLKQHGFARNRRWDVVEHAAGHAQLQLGDDAESRASWPHAFTMDLAVDVAGDTLSVVMTVRNTDTTELSFTAAFHPYFAMTHAFASTVEGLRGCRYRDALQDGAMRTESGDRLAITGALDRIFYQAPDTLRIVDGAEVLTIEKRGFPEAVVWNPGASGTSSRADFLAGEESRMLCVEAAVIEQPIVLAPGATFTGAQVMRAG
jgi:glucose-6-phosphate 1-epimerase